jgi:hypothetical protein
MAANPNIPQPLLPGPRVFDGTDLNRALGNNLVNSQDGLVALAGGGAAGATQLTLGLNYVKTTVTANDSALLPASIIGGSVKVKNGGASNLTIYAYPVSSLQSGVLDTINGTAGATGVTVAPGATAEFNCSAAGAWWGPVGAT